jgi:hypothetical protein
MNVVEIIPQFREYLKSLNVGPALASLLLIENTVPISSAEAERGFSQMNLIATDLRSRLLVSNVSDVLFVRLNGPLPHTWNPVSAMRSWLLKGHRRADDTRSKILSEREQSSAIAKLFSYH